VVAPDVDRRTADGPLDVVLAHWRGPVACYPECGEWENPNFTFGELTPEELADASEAWVQRGVRIVGGCCGIGQITSGPSPNNCGAGYPVPGAELWRNNLDGRAAATREVIRSRGEEMFVARRRKGKSYLDCRGAAIRMLI
jgi:hypothetical protein